MWTHLAIAPYIAILLQNRGHEYSVAPVCPAVTASTLLRRLLTRILSSSVGIRIQSVKRASVRSDWTTRLTVDIPIRPKGVRRGLGLYPWLEQRSRAQTLKTSPVPLSLLHQTVLLALWRLKEFLEFILLASTKPSFIHQPADSIAKHDSSLQKTRFHCSRVFSALLQPTLVIAHIDLRLACSFSVLETDFVKLPMPSSCSDVASRCSLGQCSEWCNRG